MQGFKGSICISVGVLLTGYVILWFTRTTIPVFIGSLLMMTGYMTGMSVFGAMIRDHIPEKKSGQFQGIRIIGQVLIPGIIGPAIGAYVLRDAQQILNNDGTSSFLPNANIWAAAIITGFVLCMGLGMIFHMMRIGHYDLISQTGEEFLQEKQEYQKYQKEFEFFTRYWDSSFLSDVNTYDFDEERKQLLNKYDLYSICNIERR